MNFLDRILKEAEEVPNPMNLKKGKTPEQLTSLEALKNKLCDTCPKGSLVDVFIPFNNKTLKGTVITNKVSDIEGECSIAVNMFVPYEATNIGGYFGVYTGYCVYNEQESRWELKDIKFYGENFSKIQGTRKR